MRHMRRQHKVSISHLHDVVAAPDDDSPDGPIDIEKAATDVHKGDLFTKEMDVHKFCKGLNLIQINETQIDETEGAQIGQQGSHPQNVSDESAGKDPPEAIMDAIKGEETTSRVAST